MAPPRHVLDLVGDLREQQDVWRRGASASLRNPVAVAERGSLLRLEASLVRLGAGASLCACFDEERLRPCRASELLGNGNAAEPAHREDAQARNQGDDRPEHVGVGPSSARDSDDGPNPTGAGDNREDIPEVGGPTNMEG